MTELVKTRPDARIRPALFTDAGAIGALHVRNGLGDFDARAWQRQWESYPFAADFQDVPIGWVLETETGALAGTISNVQMLYELEGRRLKTVFASSWAVDSERRGRALHLTTAFFKQKGVDLLLNVSASPTTSKILTGLKIPRIPIPDYGTPCFWAANSRAFAKAVLQRRGLSAAALLAWPAGVALTVRDILRRSGRGKPSGTINRLYAFDERFDALWQRIAAGPSRLRAVRTRAVLDWKFREELDKGRAAVLASGTGDKLSGYIVLLRRPGSDLGMSLYDVADYQAAWDDPAVYNDLLLAAIQLARDEDVDAVKLMTGTPAKRSPAMALHPYTYQLPFWQLYYRAAPELMPALASASAWDFSLFDTY
jgi:hypothetical protein